MPQDRWGREEWQRRRQRDEDDYAGAGWNEDPWRGRDDDRRSPGWAPGGEDRWARGESRRGPMYGGRGYMGGVGAMGPGAERNYGGDWDRDRRRGGYGGRAGSDEERGFFDRAADEVSGFGDDEAERRRQQDARAEGRYRGHGPRGYRRSDDRIRDDVNDRLTDDPYVDASDVDVRVENGEVTLTGTVDSRMVRRRAEDVAETVSGVSHVQNNLRVRQQGGTQREGEAAKLPETGGPMLGGGVMTGEITGRGSQGS
jgi:osmotically-inducible protein OsmY